MKTPVLIQAALAAAVGLLAACPRPAPIVCGDGFFNPMVEDCDDGNLNAGDGCSALCTIEDGIDAGGGGTDAAGPGTDAGTAGTDAAAPGTDAASPGTDAASGPFCGNGVVEGAEACDDGDTMGGDGCSGACTVQPGWMCMGSPSVCTMMMMGTPMPSAAGDLVITEIMPNPMLASDDEGEWFEVHNPTSGAFELGGLTVQDDGSDSFTITGPLVIPAGGYFVFARNGDPSVNGGMGVDYVYGTSWFISNTSDELEIRNGSTTIDRVAYATALGWSIPDGEAMSLNPISTTAAANDLPGAWCNASIPYGVGDLGTPGLVNSACP